MRKNLLVVSMLLCGAVSLFAKSGTSTIKGQIIDEKGAPLTGANIWIAEINKGTITNEKGEFLIESVPEGSYELDLTYIGYEPESKLVTVRAEKDVNQKFTLREKEIHMDEVVVRAGRRMPNQKLPYTLSRLPVELKAQPQTISVVDRKLLDEQDVTDVKDAILNVPGAYSWATYGGAMNSFGARGYRGISFMKDGILMETSQPEMDGVEEVQVIKGASAVLFGNVSPGGIINLSSKRPKTQLGGDVKLSYGSFNTIRTGVDVWGGLDRHNKVSFRLNTSYEKGDSYRKFVEKEKFYFNPSLFWRIGNKSDLLVQYDYLSDNRTPDNGTILYDWKIYDLPFDRFTGLKSDNIGIENQSLSATFNHRFTDQLTLRAVVNRTLESRDDYRIDKHSNVIQGTSLLKRLLTSTENDYKHTLVQIDLLGANFKTGFVTHNFQAGMDFRTTDKSQLTYKSAVIDTIDVINGPIRNDIANLPKLSRDKQTDTRTSKIGFMAQDIMNLGKHFRASLGLRYTGVFNTEKIYTYTDSKTKVSPKSTPHGFSPSAGLSYLPVENMNIFATYTNTFTPVTLRGINGEELGNEITNQFEAGIKSDFLQNKLSFNATYFYIHNNNQVGEVLAQDANGSWVAQGYGERNGEIRNQGVELEFHAYPAEGLHLQAGYAYIDAKYIKSVRYKDNTVPFNTPKNTFNVWGSYTFNKGVFKGLFLGAGVYYTGERNANDQVKLPWHGINPGDPVVKLKAFTELNANIGYSIQNWRFKLSAKNLLDERAYLTYRYNFINPITPRNFNLTVNYQF
ncbi:MAG: TonB-dependent siderophore receptor [Bacteroidales bacterium]